MEDLISIIIPVYNVEKYLDRCVNGIVNQTYKNLEIILVDDGSADNSSKMCNDWAKKDARIKVIHKQNGGQSSARNVGISLATGKYIGFVDSDDWVSVDMYEYLWSLIKKYNVDIAQISLIESSCPEENVGKSKETIKEYVGNEVLIFFATDDCYSVCRCLFRARVLRGLTFREGKINEDIDYKFRAFSNCQKLVVSNQIKYFYFQDSYSTTRGGLKVKDFDLYDAADELYRISKNNVIPEVVRMGEIKKARTAFSLLCKISYYGIEDEILKKENIVPKLLSEHRQNTKILLCSQIPLSRKILAAMFFLNYGLTEFCIKLAKKILNSYA